MTSVLLIAFAICGWLLPLAVTIAKGRYWLAFFGIVGNPAFVWWGSLRLARPDSWWWRRKSDEHKQQDSHRRFPARQVPDYYLVNRINP